MIRWVPAKTLLQGVRYPTFGTEQREGQLLDFVDFRRSRNEAGASVQDLQVRRFGCNPAAQVGDYFPAMAVCLKPMDAERTLHY